MVSRTGIGGARHFCVCFRDTFLDARACREFDPRSSINIIDSAGFFTNAPFFEAKEVTKNAEGTGRLP